MGKPAEEIVVVAHFSAMQGKEGELLNVMHSLLEPTRREPGCMRYELNQEIENPRAFTFAEKFAAREAFEAHLKMPHVASFADQSASLVESKQVRFHRELLPVPGDAERSGRAERNETQVIVIAHFTAKPGKKEELSTFLQGLVGPTRQEPGCTRYEVNQDLDDPATFTFVETFANRRAFESHCRMPYIAKLFETLPVLVEKQYIGQHRQILA